MKRPSDWYEVEEKMRQPRKKRPKMKVSGRSVMELRRIIARRRKTR